MITVVGLGPGDFERVPSPVQALLLDPGHAVVARTAHHPAAAELARRREVFFCDDLYESEGDFPAIYAAIADRVISHASSGSVIYAVPGSPTVGEFAVRAILDSGSECEVVLGESFIDALLTEVGYDPLDRGLQILNGHDLPDPLILDKPTIIANLDSPEALADVLDAVSRVIPEETPVTICRDLGSSRAEIVELSPEDHNPAHAGLRTSMFVDAEPGGLIGAIRVMRRLRDECPWDREQTHHSLVKNLVEETYELVEAIGRLPRDGVDWVAYAAVEDELGDVLLQVLFHETISRASGAFDIDGIGEVLRQKLIRRHPHVFADVEVEDASDVKANWDSIKAAEGDTDADSAMAGLPGGLPALHRAAKIQNRAAKLGFDWESAEKVVPKVAEELEELVAAMSGAGDPEAEVGDLMFSVINLARHLGIDPELALGRANATFERRFRAMEAQGPLDGLDLASLNQRWDSVKVDQPRYSQ